jgi:hypothetical protein
VTAAAVGLETVDTIIWENIGGASRFAEGTGP